MKHATLLLMAMLFSTVSTAQESVANSLFKSELKSYVVVGILLIIFTILFAFLFWLDSRLKKLEERS
ncbi:MAG: CcmD family protein [Chitinophagales bacterium]|nr:CcmD family protein [Chitinophagales bacterium]